MNMIRNIGNRLQLFVITVTVFIIMASYFMIVTLHRNENKFKILQFRRIGSTKVKMCPTPKIEIESFNQARLVRISRQNHSVSENKIILLWTKYFNRNFSKDFYFFQEDYDIFKRYQCPFSRCIVTNNKSLIKAADAVFFHLWDISLELPKFRSENQKWILYTLESLSRDNSWIQRRTLFNWTMSYRDDSDIKVKYGEVCELPRAEQNYSLKTLDYYKTKSKEVVWFVSNCHSRSNRIKYAKKLSKYIDIDVYGVCGSRRCAPSQSKQCYENILKDYKFYLSFENSICKDYVTEKFYNILNYDIIPVVMGGVDYDSISPPHSFIDTRDFPNPKDLATYLKIISRDKNLYNSYFEWKGKYKSYLYPWMCELCQKLHESDEKSSMVDRNSDSWWNSYSECEKWDNDVFVNL